MNINIHMYFLFAVMYILFVLVSVNLGQTPQIYDTCCILETFKKLVYTYRSILYNASQNCHCYPRNL